jgi:hypothetical protein
MTLSFDYSDTSYPPTPTMEVMLATAEEGFASPVVTAIIDTGADASFAPTPLLESIRAPLGKPLQARSLWGELQAFPTCIVDVRIGNLTYPAIEVLGYHGNEIVLGRDVLNKLWLGLDGPEETTEVSESNPRRKRR